MSNATFQLPPRSEVGYLPPEIAGEGQKVILSDGETVNWSPPPVNPVIPDMSQIKSIRHYFNRRGYTVWPAWLYHPTKEPRLVKSAEEAAELGVCYRQATIEERGRYGVTAVWDHTDDSQWRSQPYPGAIRFDPTKLGHGKTYVPTAPNPMVAQNELVRALIPEVAAAVAMALKSAGGPTAPASIDPATWDEFLAFQAWKKTSETVEAELEKVHADAAEEDAGPTNKLSADGERSMWEETARDLGIKVDRRWSVARLKEEVDRATSKAA